MNFQDMVKGLVKSGDEIAEQMTAQEAHSLHMGVGISGEAGELLDAIKKYVVYKNPLDMVNVVEELGDLEFYMEGLRQGLGISREETIQANNMLQMLRYGSYSNIYNNLIYIYFYKF